MQPAAPSTLATRKLRVRVYAEMAGAALLCMNITWLAAFYSAFSLGELRWARVAAIIALVAFGSHYLARLLEGLHTAPRMRRAIFLAWVLLALYGSLKLLVLYDRPMGLLALLLHPFAAISSDEGPSLAAFWHLLVMALVVWRSVRLAHEPVNIEQAVRSFQIGLLTLVVYGFAIAPFTPVRAYAVAYAFLFFGFLAMAAARLAGVSELRGGRSVRFSGAWLAGIILSALVVTALAMLLAIGVHQPVLVLTRSIVMLFLALVSFLTLALTYPILLLFDLLAPLLAKLFHQMPTLTIFQEIQEMLSQFTTGRVDFLANLAPTINATRMLGRIGVLLVLLLVILAALRWRPVMLRAPLEEDLSDVQPGARHPLPKLANAFGRLANLRGVLAAARIRRIYAELMALAERLGHARRGAVTPLEFLPELNILFPERARELDSITQAYLQVRYGELPESAEAIEQVERAWNRVRADGRRLWMQRRAAR